MRLIFRLFLAALAFRTIFPMIHGISFHGSFLIALSISLIFVVMLWAVETFILGLAALPTDFGCGVALVWLIPLWILGFWLLPVLALILTADVMPQNLAVSDFQTAARAGLVLLFVGLVTSKFFWNDRRRLAQ